MSGFSYPAPFEFDKGPSSSSSSSSQRSKSHKSSSQQQPRHLSSQPSPSRQRSSGNGSNGSNGSKSHGMESISEKSSLAHKKLAVQQGSVGTTVKAPARSLGPKTKSGRVLPKPMPNPNRPLGAQSAQPNRGRTPPKSRGVGHSRSANLEQMRGSGNIRSSSAPRRQPARSPSPENDAPKPSSLRGFLKSPLGRQAPSKTQSGNLEDLRRSLKKNSIVVPTTAEPPRRNKERQTSTTSTKNNTASTSTVTTTTTTSSTSKEPPMMRRDESPEQHRRPSSRSSLKDFLTSPMRLVTPTRSKSSDLADMVRGSSKKNNAMGNIGPLDLEDDDDEQSVDLADLGAEKSTRSARTSASRSSRRRKDHHHHQHDDDEQHKTKSFKQLLGGSRSRSGDSASKNGANDSDRNSAEKSRRSSTSKELDAFDRELSLSPEEPQGRKSVAGTSMLTNFLDTLYDNYLDPSAHQEQEEDDDPRGSGGGGGRMQNSFSRLDMSLSNFLT